MSLIIVPCHAVYVKGNPRNDESWLLQPFQRGEPVTFLDHIETALYLARSQPQTAETESPLIILSGGVTNSSCPGRSEAKSYLWAAEAGGYIDHNPVPNEVLLEEFARDSLENLAYSTALYYSHRGRMPHKITIVGWPFKEERFRHHFASLGLNRSADIEFAYVGVGQPADAAAARQGEQATLQAFIADPLGNNPPLVDKRRRRNPFNHQRPYVAPPAYVADIVW